eukprot:gene9267-10869_t
MPKSLLQYHYGQDKSANSLIQVGVFGEDFNYSLVPGALPSSITKLIFGSVFNRPLLPGVLPTGLVSLRFGEDFNRRLEPGVLPSSLVTLIFGYHYNQPIIHGVLPMGLVTLEFGYRFNQQLESHVLPDNIKTLSFGRTFNHPILPGVLPLRLETLCIWNNHPLQPGVLPLDLTSLTLHGNPMILPGSLPLELQTLRFNGHYMTGEYNGRFTTGEFTRQLDHGVLPDGLTSLDLGDSFKQPIAPGVLPQTIEDLKIGRKFISPLDSISMPASITSLSLSESFDYRKPGNSLPLTLCHLTIEASVNELMYFKDNATSDTNQGYIASDHNDVDITLHLVNTQFTDVPDILRTLYTLCNLPTRRIREYGTISKRDVIQSIPISSKDILINSTFTKNRSKVVTLDINTLELQTFYESDTFTSKSTIRCCYAQDYLYMLNETQFIRLSIQTKEIKQLLPPGHPGEKALFHYIPHLQRIYCTFGDVALYYCISTNIWHPISKPPLDMFACGVVSTT